MKVDQCHSTNSLLLEQGTEGLLWTDYQTAGRGQAGNGWESEKGKNILLSIGVKRPPIRVEEQWNISMLFALVVEETLEELVGQGALRIKWPNDIYYRDRKLAGILIEHQLDSRGIAYSVLGVGININQTRWVGNAPNPTSLKLITGRSWDREQIVKALWNRWEEMKALMNDTATLKQRYMSKLYRREGVYPYVEREVSTAPTMNAESHENAFMARIADILPTGEILLEDENKKERKYHFKQIRFVVCNQSSSPAVPDL